MSEDYYVEIDGVNYDRKLIELADGAVAGQSDGRISLEDAKALLAAVRDHGRYTGTEKNTMKYIHDNYELTAEADAWFRMEIRKWAATK